MTSPPDRLGPALDEQADITFRLDKLAREFDQLLTAAERERAEIDTELGELFGPAAAHPDTEPAGPPDPDEPEPPPTLRTGEKPQEEP